MKTIILLFGFFIIKVANPQNVGIGVPSPTYKLDVNGDINTNNIYRILGRPVLKIASPNGVYRNLYVGDSAGFSNTTGFANTFLGANAGNNNTSGARNIFIGMNAGYLNNSGTDNIFLGNDAGKKNNSFGNIFVGTGAGANNTTGYNNIFVGLSAATNNSTGIQNTFIGISSGLNNESGSNNLFIGLSAGDNNKSGWANTLIGTFSNLGSSDLVNATAIGYQSYVENNNTVILGSINGINGATSTVNVGIGTTTPTERLDVAGNLKISEELQRPVTGTSNLVPTAYGFVNAIGNINFGTSNFSVTKTGIGAYDISITGLTFLINSHLAIATPVGTVPLSITVASGSGLLKVRVFDASGNPADGGFMFTVTVP